METKIAIFYDETKYKSRIEYVFNFIFSHYFIKKKKIELVFNPNEGLDSHQKSIVYKDICDKENMIHIKPQNLIFSKNIIESKNLKSRKFQYKGLALYSLEKVEGQTQNFIENNIVNFDIIETIFFHISRYEEFFAQEDQLDHHQRMKSSEQLLVQQEIYKTPVVDHLVYVFLDCLGFKNLDITSIYSMTHDIDAIRKFPSFYKFLRAFARVITKDKSPKKAFDIIKQYTEVLIYQNDTYDTFDWLLSSNLAEEKIIYFMSGGKTKFDNFYSIDDKRLNSIFNRAKKYGYTIGLHPSYATPCEEEQLRKEIVILEERVSEKIINTRQHILHFSFKDTISILESQNIQYDSTLGFQDLIGFRCGTGHNYYLYNFNKEKESTVQEVPLVVMDGPLLMEANYDIEKSREVIFDFLAKNKELTKITFNFHNSTFDELITDSLGLKELYNNINQYVGLKVQ
ncbi:MAG TPA: hypothetical protein EYG73_10610 [Arcobacter sp.]|nr:hypothetical protein [Arcobacter sp.]